MKKKCLFNLSDQNILLTGATGYLGSSMLKILLKYDANVFINSRSEQKVKLLINKYKKNGKKVNPAVFDINDYKKVKNFFKKNKKFHTIINNAYEGTGGHFENFNENSYDQSYKVGITSVAHLIDCARNSLKKGSKDIGSASIINIASMYGSISPNPSNYTSKNLNNPPNYGSMKAALLQYTRYAAVYLAKYKIRVNSISPGAFPNIANKKNKKFISKLNSNVPLRRVGLPKDLDTSIIYLCSPNSSYVTGINLAIDGGWTAW
ncbi:SDR family oxidoreductase [Candidatus Pelagibacter sp.]|nr:SDR family oxidoreductase [Candidatus Pelagibacter sp.]